LRPDHDIRPTALGRYDEIWEHIRLHQQWLTETEGRPVEMAEAVQRWYDFIYCPIVRVTRDRGVIGRFSHHTEADVYLWVMRHRHELFLRYGHDVGPEASAVAYAEALAARRRPLARLGAAVRRLLRPVVGALRPAMATTVKSED
jgi:hypothetical protein